jgi:uncharacterized protein (TIGR00251 family)
MQKKALKTCPDSSKTPNTQPLQKGLVLRTLLGGVSERGVSRDERQQRKNSKAGSSAAVAFQLLVKATPQASKSMVVGWVGDALKVKVQAPPEDGKANQAIRELLAKVLGVAVSQVALESGFASREKRFSITGLSRDQAMRLLPPVQGNLF